jgi:hypothetical protein
VIINLNLKDMEDVDVLLTKEEFDKIPHGACFRELVLPNDTTGIFMTDHRLGDDLRCIAVKGHGNDWAIYTHWAEMNAEFIRLRGNKVHTEPNIRRVVPCTDEVFNLYRY